MASKRMFSKEIVQSSRFLRLPPTCRLLYYDLGMHADDDGYCEWYPVIQMTGAKEADLEILNASELIKVFDREVLVIQDWKVNNLIRSDRYTPSKYLGKYDLTEPLKLGIPDGNQVQPQVRLGKVRIDNTLVDSFFQEKFWPEYPRKVAKETALKAMRKINPGGDEQVKIMAGLSMYKKTSQWTRDDGKFIPHPATWINQKRWEDEIVESHSIPAEALKISL